MNLLLPRYEPSADGVSLMWMGLTRLADNLARPILSDSKYFQSHWAMYLLNAALQLAVIKNDTRQGVKLTKECGMGPVVMPVILLL